MTEESTTPPALSWLRIHRYEQFIDLPRVEFSPQENLILGINGAGKTQLLKLLEAVLAFDYRGVMREPFEIEAGLVYPDGESGGAMEVELRVKFARGVVQPSDGANAQVQLAESEFFVQGEVRRPGDPISWTVQGGTCVITSKEGQSPPIAVVQGLGFWPFVSASHKHLKVPRARCAEVRESADRVALMSEHDGDFRSLTEQIGLVVHTDSSGSVMSVAHDPEPRGSVQLALTLFLRNMTRDGKMHESIRRGDSDELFPWQANARSASFGVLLEPIGAKEIIFEPRRDGHLPQSDGRSRQTQTMIRGIRIGLVFASGAESWDSNLTFGQRRFLVMGLRALCDAGVPLLIDEVDNGLHPHLLQAFLKMCAGRQLFLASHNQLVVDATNFWSPADVREKIHIVRRRADGSQSIAIFDEKTASEVHERIEIGIQSPSDVLEAEGLW